MTKEEATEKLNRCREILEITSHMDDQNRKAFDMAIKALEQEPCDDCISRHAVLETIDNRIEQIKKDANEINKYYSHLSFAEGVHDGYCRLKCDLRILPSVTPQPKTDVLDKIRAEIVDLGQCTMNDNRASGIWACRDILDKYRAGSKE